MVTKIDKLLFYLAMLNLGLTLLLLVYIFIIHNNMAFTKITIENAILEVVEE